MTTWDTDQLHNAAVTVGEVKRLGLPVRAAEIAVTTEITESGLRNLPGGDRDSAGLFQQRPSQGWGSLAQVTDPAHAADSFLSRLAAVPGWAKIAPWLAAQDVQVSAFADGSNYRQNWTEGQGLADELYGGGVPVPGGATAAPANWLTNLITNPLVSPAGAAIADGGSAAVNAVGSAATKAVLPFVLKLAFITGGVGIVIAGLWKASDASAAVKKAAPLAVLA